MAHTPGKLTTDDGDSHCYGLFADDNDAVAYLSDNAKACTGLRGLETDRANANRLALCWNAHDALVAACEAILETNGLTDGESEAREKARSALALARGEK